MFERRQFYAQPGDPSYDAFMNGDLPQSVQHLELAIAVQGPLYSSLFTKGADFVRVRAVELPLSPYLRDYEFPAYRISSRYGERILVLPLSEFKSDSGFFSASDYLLFDASAALIHDYDQSGFLRGGWLSLDPEYCDWLASLG